jgi:uracil-DNA glycosylase family 4
MQNLVRAKAMAMGAACESCPLREETPVPCDSVKEGRALRLILVGEAPGRSEVKMGRPFVGLSGKVVDSLLTKNGLKRSETHLTNAALCRGEKDKDNEKAAQHCAPRLLKELSQLDPKIPIGLLGSTSVRSVLGRKAGDGKGISVLNTRGFVWTAPEIDEAIVVKAKKAMLAASFDAPNKEILTLKYKSLEGRARLAGRIVLPTFHPAFVLRDQSQHPVIRIDFKRIAKVVRGELSPSMLEDVGEMRVVRSTKELYALPPVVSLDIETTLTGSALTAELLCVGLGAINGGGKPRAMILYPWRKKYATGLRRFLHTREAVVGHNSIVFDKVVLELAGAA